MTAKITTDMIKPYVGEGDVMAWLKKVKLVAKLTKVTALADFIPLFLEGSALAVYLELAEKDQSDADVIEKKLVEAFTDGPFVAYAKLVSLKWVGQPVDVYANEIRRLAALAQFEGDELEKITKLTFINGFPNSISVELQQVDKIMTLPMSDVLSRARILSANSNGNSSPTNYVAAVACKPGAAKSESSASGYVFKGKCFRCDGPHLARNCPGKKIITCYRCGQEGHISRQCDRSVSQASQGNF